MSRARSQRLAAAEGLESQARRRRRRHAISARQTRSDGSKGMYRCVSRPEGATMACSRSSPQVHRHRPTVCMTLPTDLESAGPRHTLRATQVGPNPVPFAPLQLPSNPPRTTRRTDYGEVEGLPRRGEPVIETPADCHAPTLPGVDPIGSGTVSLWIRISSTASLGADRRVLHQHPLGFCERDAWRRGVVVVLLYIIHKQQTNKLLKSVCRAR